MTKTNSNLIKGLAILAVILLHALAYIHGAYNSPQQLIYITLDQWARFCMPAFIMVSGYGLAYKYQKKTFRFFSFLKGILLKLLPLYLFWSLVSIFLIRAMPNWSAGTPPSSILKLLLFGQADYQLYFVPLILQFYLLFPFILAFKKKLPLMLGLAFVLQIVAYLFYQFSASNTDRIEYLLFVSWIAYFVFGIYYQRQQLPAWLNNTAPIIALGSLALIVYSSLSQINHGLDPLPALKFTRLIIIPFALSFVLSLSQLKLDKPNWLVKILTTLGKNSYLIFLAHNLGLRIFYSLIEKHLDWRLLWVSLIWLIAIIFSQKIILKPNFQHKPARAKN